MGCKQTDTVIGNSEMKLGTDRDISPNWNEYLHQYFNDENFHSLNYTVILSDSPTFYETFSFLRNLRTYRSYLVI